jgi:hypothetical protein
VLEERVLAAESRFEIVVERANVIRVLTVDVVNYVEEVLEFATELYFTDFDRHVPRS